MKNARLLILLLALLTFGQAKAQGLSGSGTAQDPYLITNNADWTTFAQSVTGGTTYAGQTVKLTADITASTMAGVENQSFAGTLTATDTPSPSPFRVAAMAQPSSPTSTARPSKT